MDKKKAEQIVNDHNAQLSCPEIGLHNKSKQDGQKKAHQLPVRFSIINTVIISCIVHSK